MARFEIVKAFKAIVELLESYNSGNPYIKICRFYQSAPKCKSCNEVCVTERCEHCGSMQGHDPKDLIMPQF